MDSEQALLTYTCCGGTASEILGACLGGLAYPGIVIALSGPLGAGKTTFVRGFMRGWAPNESDQVSSPTFALMNCYTGPQPVYHYDCYRLHSCDDALALGIEEHLGTHGVCLVEWPERIIPLLPVHHWWLTFVYDGEDCRTVTISGLQLEEQQRLQECLAGMKRNMLL